jgi:hypothetical protein
MRNLEVPERYRKMYARAMSGKSRPSGVKCHCLMCCGWQFKEVVNCTASNCPLFPYRPRQVAHRASLDAKQPSGG